MLNQQPDILNLLKKIQDSTTEDIDEERGSFKMGDKVTYDMLGVGLTNSDLIKTLGADEHAARVNHNERIAEVVEAIGQEVARYSIMFEDGFVINDVAVSELKPVKEGMVSAIVKALHDKSGYKADPTEVDDYLRDLNTDDYNALEQAVELGNKEEIVQIMKSVGFTDAMNAESKTNEAEDATDTMRPQEKPDIKAEDLHMEDYSDEDLNKPDAKVKSKSAETGNAIRQVEDDELEQKPDKVVEPKKESKVNEEKTIKITCPHCGEEFSKEIGKDTISIGTECPHCYKKISIYPSTGKVAKGNESKTNEEETEITPSKVGLKKVSDKRLKELHSNSLRAFNHWKEGGEPAKATLAAQALEKYEDEMVRRELISDDARTEGAYSHTKERKESKLSFMKKQKPFWLCNECCKTFRSNKGFCEKCKSENVENISLQEGDAERIGLYKHVYEVWYEDKDGNESSTRVEAFDEADAKRMVKKSRVKELGKVTKVKKVSEGKVLDEEIWVEGWNPGDIIKQGGNRFEIIKILDDGNVVQARNLSTDKIEDIHLVHPVQKAKESKLHETVQELVGEVPGIDRIDQHLLNKAIRSGVIPNEWPSFEVMIDRLTKADIADELEVKDVDSLDLGEIDAVYLKHILLPKAKEAARVAREAILKEQEEDWDLTFKYAHDQIWQNPLIDKEGNPFIWQKHPIKGKRVRVFSDHQSEWVKRNAGIPVKGKVEEADTCDQEISMSTNQSDVPEAKEIKPSRTIEIVKSKVDPDAFIIRVVELPEGSMVTLDTKPSREAAKARGKELANALNAKFLGFIDESKLKEQEEDEFHKGYAYAQLTDEAHLNLHTVLDLIGKLISEEFRRGYDEYLGEKLPNESKLKEQEEDSFRTIAKGIEDKDTADKLAKEKEGQVVTDEEDEKKFAVIVRESDEQVCVRCGSKNVAKVEGNLKCLNCGHVEKSDIGTKLSIPAREKKEE